MNNYCVHSIYFVRILNPISMAAVVVLLVCNIGMYCHRSGRVDVMAIYAYVTTADGTTIFVEFV